MEGLDHGQSMHLRRFKHHALSVHISIVAYIRKAMEQRCDPSGAPCKLYQICEGC